MKFSLVFPVLCLGYIGSCNGFCSVDVTNDLQSSQSGWKLVPDGSDIYGFKDPVKELTHGENQLLQTHHTFASTKPIHSFVTYSLYNETSKEKYGTFRLNWVCDEKNYNTELSISDCQDNGEIIPGGSSTLCKSVGLGEATCSESGVVNNEHFQTKIQWILQSSNIQTHDLVVQKEKYLCSYNSLGSGLVNCLTDKGKELLNTYDALAKELDHMYNINPYVKSETGVLSLSNVTYMKDNYIDLVTKYQTMNNLHNLLTKNICFKERSLVLSIIDKIKYLVKGVLTFLQQQECEIAYYSVSAIGAAAESLETHFHFLKDFIDKDVKNQKICANMNLFDGGAIQVIKNVGCKLVTYLDSNQASGHESSLLHWVDQHICQAKTIDEDIQKWFHDMVCVDPAKGMVTFIKDEVICSATYHGVKCSEKSICKNSIFLK